MLNETIIAQIMAIRDIGVTNMFDIRQVQQEAARLGYAELVGFLRKHPNEYFAFILTGKE